jgi:hypothetical protein
VSRGIFPSYVENLGFFRGCCGAEPPCSVVAISQANALALVQDRRRTGQVVGGQILGLDADYVLPTKVAVTASVKHHGEPSQLRLSRASTGRILAIGICSCRNWIVRIIPLRASSTDDSPVAERGRPRATGGEKKCRAAARRYLVKRRIFRLL